MPRHNSRLTRLERANAPKPKFRVIVYDVGKPETKRLPDGGVDGPGDFNVFIASNVAGVG